MQRDPVAALLAAIDAQPAPAPIRDDEKLRRNAAAMVQTRRERAGLMPTTREAALVEFERAWQTFADYLLVHLPIQRGVAAPPNSFLPALTEETDLRAPLGRGPITLDPEGLLRNSVVIDSGGLFELVQIQMLEDWWRKARAKDKGPLLHSALLRFAGADWDPFAPSWNEPPATFVARVGHGALRATSHLLLSYIVLLHALAVPGMGTLMLRRLQRAVMIEGYTSIIANFCHIAFYHATARLYGWQDFYCNRNGGVAYERDPAYFFPPEVGYRPMPIANEWHLTWSPPSLRLWTRVHRGYGSVSPAVAHFASEVQDWIVTPRSGAAASSEGPHAWRLQWDSGGMRAEIWLCGMEAATVAVHGLGALEPAHWAEWRAQTRREGDETEEPLMICIKRLQLVDGLDARVVVAYFVDLARALHWPLVLDATCVPSPEWDICRVSEAHPDAEAPHYVHPYTQAGLGAWPHFYQLGRKYVYGPARPLLPVARAPLPAYERVAQWPGLQSLDERGSMATMEPPPAKRRRFECFACGTPLATMAVAGHKRMRPHVCSVSCGDTLDADMHVF